MYRFLLSPKWLAGHVLLIVGVITFVNLGFWQLRRLDERQERNALISQRLDAEPRPLDELLAAGADASSLAYRPVEVRGTYLASQQLLTVPRSLNGRPGNHVLTPLRAGAATLLVERGWVPFERDPQPNTFAPPDESVTVAGVLMPAEPGSPGENPTVVTRINPDALESRVATDLLPVYLRLTEQRPAQTARLPLAVPAPEPQEGNHLSYAVQWFAFAAIALIGYPLLVRRAARDQRRPAQVPRSGLVGSPGSSAPS